MNSGFHIVLVEPEIPTNTGNIGRLCVGFQSKLHLVGPLGFEVNDKRVKRAGLDYWPDLDWQQYDSFQDWLTQVPNDARMFFFSSGAQRAHYEVKFQPGDWLVFGKESVGLSSLIQKQFADRLITIPFPGKVRSFNLSNAVAIALSEATRQINV